MLVFGEACVMENIFLVSTFDEVVIDGPLSLHSSTNRCRFQTEGNVLVSRPALYTFGSVWKNS